MPTDLDDFEPDGLEADAFEPDIDDFEPDADAPADVELESLVQDPIGTAPNGGAISAHGMWLKQQGIGQRGAESENPEDWAIKALGWLGDKTRPYLNKAYEWNRNRTAPEDQKKGAVSEALSRSMLSSVWGDKLLDEMPDAQKYQAVSSMEDAIGENVTTAALTAPYMVGQIPQMLFGLGWAKKGAQTAEALKLEGKLLPKIAKLGAEALGAGAENVVLGGAQRAFKGEEQAPGQDFMFGSGLHAAGAGIQIGVNKLKEAPVGSLPRKGGELLERDVMDLAKSGARKVGVIAGHAVDRLADEVGFVTGPAAQDVHITEAARADAAGQKVKDTRIAAEKNLEVGEKVRPGELEPSAILYHPAPDGSIVASVNEFRADGTRKYYEVPIRTPEDALKVSKLADSKKISVGWAEGMKPIIANASEDMLRAMNWRSGQVHTRDFQPPASTKKGTMAERRRPASEFVDLDNPVKQPGNDSAVVVREDGHIKLEPVQQPDFDVSALPEKGSAVVVIGRGGQKNYGTYYGVDPVTNQAVVDFGKNPESLSKLHEVHPSQVSKYVGGDEPTVPTAAPNEFKVVSSSERGLRAGDDGFLRNPNGGFLEVKVVGPGDAPGNVKITVGPDSAPVEVAAHKVERRLPPGVASFDELSPVPLEPVDLMSAAHPTDQAQLEAVKRVYDFAASKGPGTYEKLMNKLVGGQARGDKVMAMLHARNQGSAALMRTAEGIAKAVEARLPKGAERLQINRDLDSLFEGKTTWDAFQKKHPAASEALKEFTSKLDAERTALDNRIAELGGIPDRLVIERAEGHLDPYLARKYMLYLLPPGEWAKHVRGTEAFDKAATYLINELKKGGTWVSPERVSAELETLLKAPNLQEALKTSGLKNTPFKNLLARKEIPPELRAVMGELKNGSLRMGITIGSQRAIVAKLELFQDIALDQNLSSVGRRVDMHPEPVPDVPRLYGKLAGRYVKPEIYNELITLPNQVRNLYTVANKLAGWIKSNQLASFGPFWTSLKGNIQGGIASGGLSFLRPDQAGHSLTTAAKAMHDFSVDPSGRTGDGWLILEAKKLGADWASQGEVHFSQDSRKFVKKLYESLKDSPNDGFSAIDAAQKTWDLANTPNQLFSHLLDIQDRWFRLASYAGLRRKFIAQGMEPVEAAKLASYRVNQSFPNPGNVGPAVQQLRQMVAVGAPYITSKAEDLRIRATLLQRLAKGDEPDLKWRLLGHAVLFGGAVKLMHHLSGISQEELDLAQASVSKSTKAYKPALVPFAFRDAKGRLQMLDSSPGVLELEMLAGHPDDPAWKRVAFNLATFPVAGTPIEDVAARVAEQSGLKRPAAHFRLLEGEGDLSKGAEELMRLGFAPQYLQQGMAISRKAGLTGELRKNEEQLTPGQAAARAAGIKVIPVGEASYKQAQRSSKMEALDLRKQLRQLMRSARTPEKKAEIKSSIKARIRELAKQRQDAAALKEAVELQELLNEP